MDLDQTRKLQNNIFIHDCMDEDGHEQNFLYFLGNHPTLFQDVINQGQLTIPEMNYIVQHFNDYKVDARTFENEFKRELKELLPRYNLLKAWELKDEVFDFVTDNWTREIVSARATSLAQNGTKTSTGNTSSTEDRKGANRDLPMETTGTTFEQTVDWGDGASGISENKSTGSQTISQSDVNALSSNGTDNGNTKETYVRHGDPSVIIERVWNYIVKPKAINWLTSQLSTTFILCV